MKRIFIVLFVILGTMIVVAQIPPSMMDEHGNKVRTNTIHQTFPGTATKAGHPWISVGPFGGDVMDICADPLNPEMMFAAAGIPFVSDDGGDNLQPLAPAMSIRLKQPVTAGCLLPYVMSLERFFDHRTVVRHGKPGLFR